MLSELLASNKVGKKGRREKDSDSADCDVKQMCAIFSDLWSLFSQTKLEGTKLQALSFRPSKQLLQQFWKLCEYRLSAPGRWSPLVLLIILLYCFDVIPAPVQSIFFYPTTSVCCLLNTAFTLDGFVMKFFCCRMSEVQCAEMIKAFKTRCH